MKRFSAFFLASSCLAFAPQAPKLAPSFHLNVATAGHDVGKSPSPLYNSMIKKGSKSQLADVVIDPDYTIATVFAITAASIIATNQEFNGILGAAFHAYAAGLFAVQATRLRVIFDKDSFEFKKVVSAVGPTKLKDAGANFVVGGKNRWAYKSFVNWDFYPSYNFPLLVYFKETQTPKKDGSVGQIHFFPAGKCVEWSLDSVYALRGFCRLMYLISRFM